MSAGLDREHPPVAGPTASFLAPKFSRRLSTSGLELVIAARPGPPLVEAQLLLPAGGVHNPLSRSGLATLTAALVDEGTRRRSGLDLAIALERLGASLTTGADWDAARLSVSALAEHLDAALSVLAEVAREPTFPELEVERLRRQTLAEIHRRPDHPARLAERELAATLYPGSPMGELLQGSAASVEAITREEIVAFHGAHYRPVRAQLVVCGAIDPELAETLARRHFEPWSGETPSPVVPATPPRSGIAVRVVDLPRAAQTELRIGHHGVPRTHPDRTRLGVLNALLGGKFTSRLNLNLRERHGFTYGVSSRFVDRRGGGPFVVATSVANDVVGAAATEVFAELRRIREQPASEGELAETRSYLLGVYPYTFQTLSGIVARLADLALHELPDDHLETALAEIAATTVDEIHRLASAHLRPDEAVLIAAGPADKIGPQLARFGALEVMAAE